MPVVALYRKRHILKESLQYCSHRYVTIPTTDGYRQFSNLSQQNEVICVRWLLAFSFQKIAVKQSIAKHAKEPWRTKIFKTSDFVKSVHKMNTLFFRDTVSSCGFPVRFLKHFVKLKCLYHVIWLGGIHLFRKQPLWNRIDEKKTSLNRDNI
jgi:hypothetical protein